jgi:hypothetical protein
MQHLIKRSLSVFTVLIFTGLGFSAQAADPKSYPLMCKGGSDMKIQVTTMDETSHLYIYVLFKKGSRAATAGLAAGTCAWTDRGMSASEPVELRLRPTSGAGLHMTLTPNSGGFNTAIRVEGTGQAPRTAAGLRQIIDAIQTGRQFQVYAYSTTAQGRKVLYVTKYGP